MKKTLSIGLLFLAGCLKPDPTGPGPSGGDSGIVDENLLAGATSSTNWPPEDTGPDSLVINGTSDSTFELHFYEVLNPNPREIAPIKLSGKVSLYKAGKIPALEEVGGVNAHFSISDNFVISQALLQSLTGTLQDTASFSILVEVGNNQSLITGFTYSSKLKRLIKSPFSENPTHSYLITQPNYYIHGIPDSTLINLGYSVRGKSEWCFYIPGSPFFFKVADNDTGISIGPLPIGKYPIRLLRVVGTDGGTSQNRLEVHEVKITDGWIDATHHSPYKVIQPGQKLFSVDLKTSVSIRSQSP
ncbi:MAG TPA: hypothetical protein VJ385_01750 [Fibrobacteria bacterium]|nr:hypothetical protein [Fibrobacteria bacterium]